MLSALLGNSNSPRKAFPLLDLPVELLEKVVGCFGPEDQKAKRAARAVCTELRAAVNAGVTAVRVTSEMEGQSLPASLLPQLKTVKLEVCNGRDATGLWTVENLRRLGVDGAAEDCKIDILADAAILHLRKLADNLHESGLMPMVRSFSQQSWGVSGSAAQFGDHVEVNAKLKLVRQECVDLLVHNTLQHSNLTSLCFAPMLRVAWNQELVQGINESASKTLKSLIVNFRPFQEVTLEPLAHLNLPALEHLELRAQNTLGFGPRQLEPLAQAHMPALKSVSVEMTGDSVIPHLGTFISPLVHCKHLQSIEIWANQIECYAGLWGVGLGGHHLPNLHTLSLRGSPCSVHTTRPVFTAQPHDKVIDAFLGLSLDKLALQDIGLPEGASACGIKRLVLTNPRWEDVSIAMSPTFSPHLQVIRVCGSGARAIRSKMLMSMVEPPSPRVGGWRMGSPPDQGGMHKVRSFIVLHDVEDSKLG